MIQVGKCPRKHLQSHTDSPKGVKIKKNETKNIRTYA